MMRGLPQDPMLRQLVKAARSHQVSRRAALAGIGGTAAALSLASCATAESTLTPLTDVSDSEPVLTWHNWPAYMDEDEAGNYPTLSRFEQESGITVDYRIEIDDNDTWYAKVKDQLELGQDIGADIACPTGWMAQRLKNLGVIQTFDDANMPNKVANLDPSYLGSADDPDRIYSIPWQAGFAGIGYNKKAYKEATGKDAPGSVADLWAAELRGRVGLLSEMRDSVGIVLMAEGIDITSTSSLSEDAFMSAIEIIKAQIDAGQIFNVRGNSYLDDLATGNIIAATAWSGDITVANIEAATDEEPEPFGFIFPESGATIWADVFVTPMGATHKKNAEKLIDFYYDPVNAAELALWVNFITPVVGAKEVAFGIDPVLAENQLIFPSEQTLSNTQAFRALTGQEEQRFSSAWQNLLLGA
ncbi:PotD/PotF family extracellular solute-binding protein [Candidatus Aquiluna sp. UB-MaderosW2red]|uniref:ABC transporter substrate-binding protein n=1 Tax=Candidatus Aquiluna sp. UB-MaderosW2red TaxID=1855377 RepID=UPI000875CAE8|nr:spermidine/putrescine ABC transporter substrate-binding protein [Candidatus Aquiluna sp. UB-MaderosW2red]SCX13711.1 spermidine/putrescine transport system substrate-binding protein [Candidatus Aquiluna sp. UB-MaderosW2red]